MLADPKIRIGGAALYFTEASLAASNFAAVGDDAFAVHLRPKTQPTRADKAVSDHQRCQRSGQQPALGSRAMIDIF